MTDTPPGLQRAAISQYPRFIINPAVTAHARIPSQSTNTGDAAYSRTPWRTLPSSWLKARAVMLELAARRRGGGWHGTCGGLAKLA
eukprot:3970846-Prymnesium_polylepis.1